jgi:hypothetical protein
MNVLNPQPPFLWPEPQVIEGQATYEQSPPIGLLAQSSKVMFGIVSAPTDSGITILESWMKNNPDLQVCLNLMVYPTCQTSEEHLARLLEMVEQSPNRLTIYVHPLGQVTDRTTNVLCFFTSNSDPIYLATGATGDLGLGDRPTPSINLVFRAEPTLYETFKRYFDWLCGQSWNITDVGVTKIPSLILPEGTEQGAPLWREYLSTCENALHSLAQVDPQTGELTIVKDGQKVVPPSEKLGLPEFDLLAERMARLYEKGTLVSIDKLSRIPPLDAPLDPSLFGDASEHHKGNVTRKVRMRVSIIDDKTLKDVEKCRNGLQNLLKKFTFGIADGMRWIPVNAQELFESEIKHLNEKGEQIISDLLKGDVKSFIEGKRKKLKDDINAMYSAFGRSDKVTEEVIEQVVKSFEDRLTKAQTANFVPTLSYSNLSFSPTENDRVSPWGQAYTLLADIALFPRKALIDNRGLKVEENDLLQSMNVAEDALFRNPYDKGIKTRCKADLALLSRIKNASLENKDRCKLVWGLLDGKSVESIDEDLHFVCVQFIKVETPD